MMGMKLTSTVARNGLIAVRGINGKGGHQQVKFLMMILYGIGGVPHACTEWIVDGKQSP